MNGMEFMGMREGINSLLQMLSAFKSNGLFLLVLINFSELEVNKNGVKRCFFKVLKISLLTIFIYNVANIFNDVLCEFSIKSILSFNYRH